MPDYQIILAIAAVMFICIAMAVCYGEKDCTDFVGSVSLLIVLMIFSAWVIIESTP